jgi:nicotinate phosphoribosyltransferase
MAHAYVTSFENEIESFRKFAQIYQDRTVLLIDTFDTLNGARNAIRVATEMAAEGKKIRGVRLDSGDMTQLSRQVRAMFDEAGLHDIEIFASGGFDEYKIEDCLARGARIDGFGVGTKMAVSADAPYTDIAYKLVQYDGRPVLKLSSGKKTFVGEKQVYRVREKGRLLYDVIALKQEPHSGAEELLRPVMRDGQRLQPDEPLNVLRDRLQSEMAELSGQFKRLRKPEPFPVKISSGLEALQSRVERKARRNTVHPTTSIQD